MINESWVGQRLSAYSGGSASSAQPEPPSMAPYIGGLKRRGCSEGRSLVGGRRQLQLRRLPVRQPPDALP